VARDAQAAQVIGLKSPPLRIHAGLALSNAALLCDVDLHADRGHDSVQGGERRIGRAAFDVRNVRLVDAGDLCDLFLSQVSCAPRLSDLATWAKVRAEGLELFDALRRAPPPQFRA